MCRLSFIAFLLLTIFANFVFANEVVQTVATNSQNEATVSVLTVPDRKKESPKVPVVVDNVKKNNVTLDEARKKGEASREQVINSTLITSTKRNEIAASVQNVLRNASRPIENTTPTTGEEKDKLAIKKMGNFSGEQANLNECCVTPSDEEEGNDVTTIQTPKEKLTTSTVSTLGPTSTSTVVTTLKDTNVTDIDPPNVFPTTKDVQSIKTATSDMIAKLNPVTHKTFTPESSDVTEAIVSKRPEASTVTVITPTIATTIATVVSTNATSTSRKNQTVDGKKTTVEGLEDLHREELIEKGINEKSSEGSKSGSMPSGIIALVTAITIAVAIVIGYIGMVVWKQYLEHRYGRRELLVNELEFDTNDLRHFEL